MPSFEEYRFLTELFNLSYLDSNYNSQSLTPEQILAVFSELKNTREANYTKIRKLLKMSADIEFSIEKSKSKDKIKISTVNHFFSDKLLFAGDWNKIPLPIKDRITEIYFSEELSITDIEAQLKELNLAELDEETVTNLMEKYNKLPNFLEAVCSYSSKALQEIVKLTLEEKRHPSLVVADLLINESKDHTLHNRLGYYGASIPDSTQPIPKHIQTNGSQLNPDEKQFGRIANPTVHAALNQIRHVVNDLILHHGKPESIHIEFARDLKKSKDEKDQDRRKQKENEDRNRRALNFIEEHTQKPSAFNFERVKLWFELESMKNQFCIYSGKPISARMVLSDEVQVDHILPFSKTLDDGLSNKVLVLASENVKKGNKTPFDAFNTDQKKWAGIQERIKLLPYKKQWRFAADAIKKFEGENDFLQRHLNDTRYISKITRKYLESIIDKNKLMASKGQVTSLIRRKLGLGKLIQNQDGTKNRDDHRHHAIDALTVALTSRSYLKKISDASARSKDPEKIPISQPWENFINEAKEKFNEIVVSHKVDHGTNGPFMEETCFGLIANLNSYEKENDFKLITTKSASSLDSKKIETIVDSDLRNLANKSGIDKLPSKVKKLRVYDVTKENIEDIGSFESGLAKITHGKNKEHTKLYKKGDISYLAIWRLPQKITLKQENHKTRKSDYIFTAIKTFDLNSKIQSKKLDDLKPHPAAKLVAKIYKGDTVTLTKEQKIQFYVVKSIRAANTQLLFMEIHKNKELQGEKQFLLSFSKLSEYQFRKIYVSPSGHITDRGPILK